jgi:hypothetical protein
MRWLAVLVLVACSENTAPKASPLVGDSRKLADKMCACHEAACADAIEKEWNALLASHTLSADDVDKLAAETQRFTNCLWSARPR